MRITARVPLAAVVAVLALLAAACGGGETAREPLDTDRVFGSTEAPRDRSGPPDPRPDAGAPPSGSATEGGFPPLFHPEQGDPYWTAVVAYAEEDPDDPSLTSALQAVRKAGYPIEGVTDAGCVPGVEQIIDMGEEFKQIYLVELSFATEADARAFERKFGQDIAGIAQVNGSCLD